MPVWLSIVLGGVAFVAAGFAWWWDARRSRPATPTPRFQVASHVRVLRGPVEIQEAAARSAESHRETVAKLSEAERRMRRLAKTE